MRKFIIPLLFAMCIGAGMLGYSTASYFALDERPSSEKKDIVVPTNKVPSDFLIKYPSSQFTRKAVLIRKKQRHFPYNRVVYDTVYEDNQIYYKPL